MLQTDLLLIWDAELLAIAQEYAEDEATFLAEFGAAWTQLMNADRFSGPASNFCDGTDHAALAGPALVESA